MSNSLISKPLSYICNKSIQTGVFPDRHRCAVWFFFESMIEAISHCTWRLLNKAKRFATSICLLWRHLDQRQCNTATWPAIDLQPRNS